MSVKDNSANRFLLGLGLAFQELGFFGFVLGCTLCLRLLEHRLARRVEDAGVIKVLKGRVQRDQKNNCRANVDLGGGFVLVESVYCGIGQVQQKSRAYKEYNLP